MSNRLVHPSLICAVHSGIISNSSRLLTRLEEMSMPTLTVRTPTLEIAYEAYGDDTGFPLILLHGFPDDVHAWDTVAPPLAAAGYRVLVPYLRGYGPTRFLDDAEPRMAQQAAMAQDLMDLMDALDISRAGLSGYDWGGRAACITAILQPERVAALVTIGGYNVQNTLGPQHPVAAVQERSYWYQWYFNTERGRLGLEQNRHDICRLLWEEWSPTWHFDDATYERTAPAFENPDFVPIVIHSYRHRHQNAPSNPRFDAIEQHLSARPPITVPTIILHGADDTVSPPQRSEREMGMFPAATERHVVAHAGHFMPREQPHAVVEALLKLSQQQS
jgi:pimeloyl-ACP methyl ester carboxylesterase